MIIIIIIITYLYSAQNGVSQLLTNKMNIQRTYLKYTIYQAKYFT